MRNQPDGSTYGQQGWFGSIRRDLESRAIEVFKSHAQRAISAAADQARYQAGDVFRRVPQQLAERYSPAHVETILRHSSYLLSYEAQRFHQILNLADMFVRPIGHVRENYANLQHPLRLGHLGFRKLDSGGPGARLRHLTYASGDYIKDSAASILGGVAVTVAVANTPGNRAKTRAMRDRLFPPETFYGRVLRWRAYRFLFTNPVSRIAALPHVFGSLALYQHLVNVGQSYDAYRELERNEPAMHAALKQMAQDYLLAKASNDFLESLRRTSTRQQLPS